MFTYNKINWGSYMLINTKTVVNTLRHMQDLKLIFNIVEKWDGVSNAFYCIMILLIERCETK